MGIDFRAMPASASASAFFDGIGDHHHHHLHAYISFLFFYHTTLSVFLFTFFRMARALQVLTNLVHIVFANETKTKIYLTTFIKSGLEQKHFSINTLPGVFQQTLVKSKILCKWMMGSKRFSLLL